MPEPNHGVSMYEAIDRYRRASIDCSRWRRPPDC
jgi:hypothetical protein